MRHRMFLLSALAPLPLGGCAFDPDNQPGQDVLDRLDALESSVQSQQTLIDQQQALIEELQTQLTALDTSSGLPRFIDEDLTMAVPADYADVNAALDALAGSVISGDATVTIQIADGDYSYDEPVRIRHHDGASIAIVGNEADKSAVTLRFTDTDGVVVPPGGQLGYIGGLTLVREDATAGIGLNIQAGATASWGPLSIEDFGLAGVWVDDNGALVPYDPTCPSGVGIDTFNGTYGFAVIHGGVADLCHASSDAANYANYYVYFGGVADLADAVGTNSGEEGIKARFGGVVSAERTQISGCTDTGVEVRVGASAWLEGSADSESDWVTVDQCKKFAYATGEDASIEGDYLRSIDTPVGFYASDLSVMALGEPDASGYSSGIAYEAIQGGALSLYDPTCGGNSCSETVVSTGTDPKEGYIWTW